MVQLFEGETGWFERHGTACQDVVKGVLGSATGVEGRSQGLTGEEEGGRFRSNSFILLEGVLVRGDEVEVELSEGQIMASRESCTPVAIGA